LSGTRSCSSAPSLTTVSASPIDRSRLKPNLLAPDTKLGLWRQSCNRALASLEDFSQHLLSKIKRFRECGDKSGADVISSSCITCLAHLAILYEAVCRTDPVAEEMYNLCDLALQRLGVLTFELQLDEYTYLDLLLGVCPCSCRFLVIMTQRDAWITGLLEQITTGLRRPHREPPLGREWDIATFPEACR